LECHISLGPLAAPSDVADRILETKGASCARENTLASHSPQSRVPMRRARRWGRTRRPVPAFKVLEWWQGGRRLDDVLVRRCAGARRGVRL